MGENNNTYFGRSWEVVSRDGSWWKAVLIMGIAAFVPVVGVLGILGYALERARLTAWGMDSNMAGSSGRVSVGRCIRSGWRGFVAVLGWDVIWVVLSAWLLNASDGDGFVRLLLSVCSLFVTIVLAVCALRATIYQNFKAGYQANRIWDMLKRDFDGIARITGIYLLIEVIVGIFTFVLSMTLIAPHVAILAVGALSGEYTEQMLVNAVPSLLGHVLPALAVLLYLVSVANSFGMLVVTTAVGLWMRNFNVPAWGRSADPLPLAVATLPAPSRPMQTGPTQDPGQDVG